MSSVTTDCQPLTTTRRLEDFPIANEPIARHLQRQLAATGVSADPHAWLNPYELAAFVASGKSTLVDSLQGVLAWLGAAPNPASEFVAHASFLIRYPWDLLRANEQAVADIEANRIEGGIHPLAVIEGHLHLGLGSQILPGVVIEGNAVIGANCKIGPNCYIRGNTSIGDHCHVGHAVEIKNSLILSHTSIGHLSYVGDSVIGEHVNLGAGTITANFRHDGQSHRSMVHGVLHDSGRQKFGAIIGDHVHTGIHTAIYPGRKLWPGTTTRPGEIVSKDLVD